MRPALLVIDVQNEYFAPHGKWVIPEGEEVLARIQELLAAFRAANSPVFHIMHEALDPASPVFRRGSAGAELHPAIETLPGEQKIVKHFPGSFAYTPLEIYLRRAGIDTLVISGYMTHLCCDTTTRQASERNFTTLFAADATGTRDLNLHGHQVSYRAIQESTLAIMNHFATVLTTQEIISRLQT
ncbi:MAG: cysteine hydrolase family protein [Ktedonobacteraceae bacterium]